MVSAKSRPAFSRIIRWVFAALLGTALLAGCALFFLIRETLDNYGKQLATMIATDDRIAAFGDGAHAVPITPEAALAIGQPAVISGLRITVLQSAEVEDTTALDITAVGYQYWHVRYTVENVSEKELYPHPVVDAQMQYSIREDGGYIWVPSSAGECSPSITKGVPPLKPKASFDCTLIYNVPRGGPLYWVYSSSGYEASVVYRVR